MRLLKHESAQQMIIPEAQGTGGQAAFSRLHGKMDVVLGMASSLLHSTDGYKASDLRLKKSIFAPWWVLTGKAPARGRQRKVFSVKIRSTSQRSLARKGYRGRRTRRITRRKEKTFNNKEREGGGGANCDTAKGKPRTPAMNSGSHSHGLPE